MKKLTSPREWSLWLLSKREYSVQQLQTKLIQKFPDNKEITNTIEEFKKKNWLSNSRFCECFIRDQIQKLNGPQKIREKLLSSGVSETLISEKLAKLYPKNKQDLVIKKLKKKKENTITFKKLEENIKQQKFKNYLNQRGFFEFGF